MRREWGCDAPTREAQLYIPCLACDGAEDDCKVCSGLGLEPIHRCPNAVLDPTIKPLFYLWLSWPGVLPEAGGLHDQPAIYVEAMRLLDVARGRMEREVQEMEEDMRHG